MSENTYIWCKNYNEFSELMKILHSKGYKWASGKSTLEWEPYRTNRDRYNGIEILITRSHTVRFGDINMNNGMSFTYFKFKEGIKVNKFTKTDLKDGMIVRTADDDLYVVFKDKLVDYTGYIKLDMYSDDLCHIHNADWTIIEVYDSKLERLDLKFIVEGKLPIWKRCLSVEMTIAEIEEKLGIKNLKIVER